MLKSQKKIAKKTQRILPLLTDHFYALTALRPPKRTFAFQSRAQKGPLQGSIQISATKGRTKTEQRVLKALYELQKLGDSSSGKLGTYETLMEETLASKPALLSTCQRLTKEGVIIRRKINAADRKRWDDQWTVGFARRQAHYSLTLEMFRKMEAAEDDFKERFNQDFDRQIAEDRAGFGLQILHGGYRIHDDDPGPSWTARRKAR